MSFCNEKEAKKLMQKLPAYVLIEKPKIKHLSNIDLLYELPFYDELSVVPAGKYWSLRRPKDVPLQSPKDPILLSRGHPDLTSRKRLDPTSWGRPEMTSRRVLM